MIRQEGIVCLIVEVDLRWIKEWGGIKIAKKNYKSDDLAFEYLSYT